METGPGAFFSGAWGASEGAAAGAALGAATGAWLGSTIENQIIKLESRSRGKSDPVSGLKPMDPGRDCDGNCNPCPPPEIWEAPGDAHGSTGGVHYHGIVWNQDPVTCMCHPKRVAGPSPDKLK